MRWEYQDIGLTRQEAEDKIQSIGFKSCSPRGFELKLKKGRFHIVPSGNGFNIHRDNNAHHVVKDKRTLLYNKRFYDKLNTFSFRWKVKLFIRRIKNKL